MTAETTALRERLSAAFPLCIYPKGGPKYPLKRDIHLDVIKRMPDLTVQEVKAALADYTGGPSYLEKLKAGAERYDLDGWTDGFVTEREEKHAQRRLAALRARWASGVPAIPQPSDRKAIVVSQPISSNAVANSNGSARLVNPALQSAEGFASVVATLAENGKADEIVKILIERDRQNVEYGKNLRPLPATVSLSPEPVTVIQGVEPAEIGRKLETILGLIPHRKIEAIKVYRDLTHSTLKEAKDWVEGRAKATAIGFDTPDRRKVNGFMVLVRSGGSYSVEVTGTYDYRDEAVRAAQTKTLSVGQANQVILAEVLGRTKPVFELLDPAA